ncbi:MAG: hypothetical protein R2875_13750 [Desulfobacterales bacterium]
MYLFDQDILFKKENSGTYATDITKNWSINGNPLTAAISTAVIAHAMTGQSSMKDLIICTATYLAKTLP